MVWVIAAGFTHWSAALAFDFPQGAFHIDQRTAMGLGAALSIAMYNYFGYYQVCYLADEVAAPARTIPRSILISVLLVAFMYLAMNLAILGVIPWRDGDRVAPHRERPGAPGLRFVGGTAGDVAIVWTAFASVFAAMLGYSRIPFAAARAGDFFRAFGKLHPVGGVSAPVAGLDRRSGGAGLPRRARDRHRRPGGGADPDPVRRTDHRRCFTFGRSGKDRPATFGCPFTRCRRSSRLADGSSFSGRQSRP